MLSEEAFRWIRKGGFIVLWNSTILPSDNDSDAYPFGYEATAAETARVIAVRVSLGMAFDSIEIKPTAWHVDRPANIILRNLRKLLQHRDGFAIVSKRDIGCGSAAMTPASPKSQRGISYDPTAA